MRTWLLPEFVEDVLPDEARAIETYRGRLLELFRVHGYELVAPPMLEYIESLLTGTGHDLDLRTFKLIDQMSGRTMGLRADMTPQVARIDAHLLNREGVARLCYCGTVLNTRPRGLTATREPLQIGAEIYGHAGIESDVEIQQLLRAALAACGLENVRLDVGHVGVFRAIARRGGVTSELESDAARSPARKGPAGARRADRPARRADPGCAAAPAGALRRRRSADARGGRAAALSGNRGGARRARRAGARERHHDEHRPRRSARVPLP